MKIAVITARGGSKRIPKKNIRSFCGKPILAYSIAAAQQSGLFDEVMVSTDSDEIAQIAQQWGASVPFMRSAENSNDFATTAQVLLEVLDEYEARGKKYEEVCCIYPTAPFVTAKKLCDAYELMKKNAASAVVPVVRFSFPPQRGFVFEGEALRYQYPQYEKARSQDLQPVYHDCGQFYWCATAALRQYQSLVVPGTAGFVVPEEEVQDIDTLSDWNIAEMKFQRMKKDVCCDENT